MCTVCIGGVIRDIAAGAPSVMMRHELYATAALVATIALVGLTGLGLAQPWPMLLGAGLGFALRAATIRWHLALPPRRGR